MFNNRVTKIGQLLNIESRHQVPVVENIADLLSRGCLPEELMSKAKLWIEGLGRLKQDIVCWLITKDIQKYSDEEEFEI